MKHLADGILRRLVDEPLAISTTDRRHLESCPRCRAQFDAIGEDARWTERSFATTTPELNTRNALHAVHGRVAATQVKPAARRPFVARFIPIKSVGAVAGVAALVGALTLTPAGSLAQSFITVFQPKTVVAVPVTTADLRQLAQLRRYGTVQAPARLPTHTASTNASAATLAGMPVLAAGSGAPAIAPRYTVIPSAAASFTFSAAKARAARSTGKAIPPMPARINGSTLQVTLGTTVVTTYGDPHSIPQLIIGQMRAPIIRSTGVSLRTLENYVLHLPGISPQLASEIQQINNPASVLPIPIPVDLAQAHTVQVQGVSGLELGDSTGLGSGVVWEKDGMIYGVAGPMTDTQVLAIAGSLR